MRIITPEILDEKKLTGSLHETVMLKIWKGESSAASASS
jgi:hypothetical protein